MLTVCGTTAIDVLLELNVTGISTGALAGLPERSVSATTRSDVEWATAVGGTSSTFRASGATPTTLICAVPVRKPVEDAVMVVVPVVRDVLYVERAIMLPSGMVTVFVGKPTISAFEDDRVTVVGETALAGNPVLSSSSTIRAPILNGSASCELGTGITFSWVGKPLGGTVCMTGCVDGGVIPTEDAVMVVEPGIVVVVKLTTT